ncbi:MAG: DUF4080 domain-containing protein [Rhodopirellula sp.]|nr:DUF4080 domain-containing protein [Rhodopirellula sp.]
MADIVLATFNARYWHSAFGLRYLAANMEELYGQTTLLEFGTSENTTDVLTKILDQQPKIVGLGVYIWNIEPTTKLVVDLKRIRPEIIVVLGGPEVSYETEGQPIVEAADYVITGEADLAFPELCRQIINRTPPLAKIIHAPPPQFDQLRLPYHLYTEEDVQHRVIYVEASRGCPFTCEFCLSALEIPVRQANLETFLTAMQSLFDRGVRQFKFVDRTFNLNLRVSQAILNFFLERCESGLFLHFEMIPDRLPESLRELIAQFPPGVLQFEIGVQTFNEEVGELISRQQDNGKLAENFRFLHDETGVHIHADLIVGLPGETLASFAAGFDRLVRLQPQEIQVGILKRLHGTPITRHDAEWEMVYSAASPYEILSNRLIDFSAMHQLRRFARYWDLIANSGNFVESRDLIWYEAASPFDCFFMLSGWLFGREQRAHGIPLGKLAERLFEFLTDVRGLDQESVAASLWRDYVRGGRRDRPAFLREFDLPQPGDAINAAPPAHRRQALHVKPVGRS